jgi:hypothetical protein
MSKWCAARGSIENCDIVTARIAGADRQDGQDATTDFRQISVLLCGNSCPSGQETKAMTFQIHPLDPAPFAPLFGLDDAGLRARGARRVTATSDPGFPCRVSLADAAIGETLILANHAHLVGPTPYAATHAIYIREGAVAAMPAPDTVPEVLARRLLSVRGFDAEQMLVDADVVDGRDLADHLARLFGNGDIAFVHVHFARPGCFAAAVTRA